MKITSVEHRKCCGQESGEKSSMCWRWAEDGDGRGKLGSLIQTKLTGCSSSPVAPVTSYSHVTSLNKKGLAAVFV